MTYIPVTYGASQPTPGQSGAGASGASTAQAQVPNANYLSQLLQSLGRQPITTPGALGTNLLAEALLRYGQQQRQKQAQAAAAAKADPAPQALPAAPQPGLAPQSLLPGTIVA